MMQITKAGPAILAALAVSTMVSWNAAGCARRKSAATKGNPAAPRVSQQAIAKFQDPAAVSDLRDKAAAMLVSLATDPDPQIRANAIEGLAESPARLEPLIPGALIDPNPGVRSTAVMMVGQLPMKSAVPTVRSMANDPSPFVRASVIYTLSRCGDQVDVTPLGGLLLRDPSPRVRSHAAFLLGELGEPSALGLLREAARPSMPKAAPAEVRLLQLQISEAMVKLGDFDQLEAIRAALYPSRPEDLEVAALAVQIIGQVKDRGAMDQLMYLTAYKDPKEGQMPAEIRLGAAMSMAKLGNTRGTFIAEEYIASPLPVVRAQAAMVLGYIGRPENLPRLEQLMADPEGIIKVSAAAGALRASSMIAEHPEGR